jgi:hypothetical protein
MDGGAQTRPRKTWGAHVLRSFIILSLLCCAYVFLVESGSYASEAQTGSWALLGLGVYEVMVLGPLVIACAIVAIFGVIRLGGVFRWLSVVILLFATLFFINPVFHSIAKAFSPILYPLVRYREQQSVQRQAITKSNAIEEHFKYFQQAFETEKIVTDVPCYDIIILDNTFAIQLPNLAGHLIPASIPHTEVQKDLAAKIKGKQVRVLLPPHDQFVQGYDPGIASGCYKIDGESVGANWPSYAGEELGEIKANVEVNGRILDLNWLRK